ncbi:MAG: hypothetical protein VYD08_04350 [Pseudomonadota bacterium]|nr:hypothetical protein [Pseudomonadota bacterium]
MMSPTEFMPPLLWLLPQEKYRFYFSQTSKNASGSQKTNSRQSGMEIAVSAADMVAYVGKAIPEHLRHLTHVQNAQGAFIWSAKHGWENEWFVELVGQWVALIDAGVEVNNQSIESLAQNNVSLPYCLDCVFDDTPFTPKFDIGFDDATQRVKLTMKLNWPLDEPRTPIDSATLLLPAEPYTLFDVRRSDGETIRGRLEDGLLPSALRA